MTKHAWLWIATGLSLSSCAQPTSSSASSYTGGSGSGGLAGPTSGGTGLTNAGGVTSSIGGASAPDGAGLGCDDGAVASCADVHASFPKGMTTCQNGYYPTASCRVCDSGDEIDCGKLPFNPNPFGNASCDPAGAFGKGDWNLDDCGYCDPGVTMIDCVQIEGSAFTGGQAVCNSSADGWVDSTCFTCGDGAHNGVLEQCDGEDVTPTTCGALDFGGVDPSTAVTTCAGNCKYDTSQCGNCAGGVAAGDCMEGGSCTAAACDGKGCARGATCEFLCRDNAANVCEDLVCSQDATCRFDCYNHGGCLGVDCRAGASCNLRCQNVGGVCSDVFCEDGASCDFSCADGGTCSTSEPAHCKSGDECTISCTNGGNCSGLEMICESGSICHLQMNQAASVPTVDCRDGATCHLHCLGGGCETITCTGDGCHCGSGECPGFE